MLAWAVLIAALPLGLEWSAPPECPTRDAVLSEVEGLLARPIEGEPLIATATIAGPPWRATLTIDGEARALTAASCAALARGAALILAMRLEARPPPPPPPPPPIPPVVRTATVARSALGLTWFARARVGAELGSLPHLGPAFGIDLGARVGRYSGSIGGTILLPNAQDLGEAGAQSVHGIYAVDLRGCRALVLMDPWELGGCALGQIGIISGESRGIAQPASASALWSAVGIEVTPSWALGDHLALALPVVVELPIRRPSFVVDPFGEVHRSRPIVGRLALSVEARFP